MKITVSVVEFETSGRWIRDVRVKRSIKRRNVVIVVC